MKIDRLLHQIERLTIIPEDLEEFNKWLSQDDAIAFLDSTATDDEIIIYLCAPFVFLHAIFAPKMIATNPDVHDLLGWSFSPYSSWGICTSGDNAFIEPPLSCCRSKLMSEGEKIIFIRSLDGIEKYSHYFQLNQQLEHVLCIHFIKERDAWCLLDENGDYEDVVRIIRKDQIEMVLMKRSFIEQYAALKKFCLIRMFDFTRHKKDVRFPWYQKKANETNINNIFYKININDDKSLSKGAQIIPCAMSSKDIADKFNNINENKQYASFIIDNFKTDTICVTSCDPKCTATYFSPPPDLPYETSPAYFRAEVMHKYKSDPDKYKINERSIECRGAWVLDNIAHNEANQVFTYLCRLRNLPYKEQLYWASFNEEPKKDIPENIRQMDFEGLWVLNNPLMSLKQRLCSLTNAPWWTLRDNTLLEQLHCPASTASKEWSNEISTLSKIINEGLEEKWLRKKATELGCTPQEKWRSIKLLEVCLSALGVEADKVKSIVSNLKHLSELRNKLSAHAGGQEAKRLKDEALEQHGTYREHFIHLVTQCDRSFGELVDILVI